MFFKRLRHQCVMTLTLKNRKNVALLSPKVRFEFVLEDSDELRH